MKSLVYSLEEPYNIKEVEKDRSLKDNWVLVQPLTGSICHADLRYFTGSRRPEALKAKLPMALIHEGVAEVVESNNSKFKNGDKVVIVPNIPARILDPLNGKDENDQYSYLGAFMGSGYDGLTQSYVVHPEECMVKVPENLSIELATLSEVSSVGVAALRDIASILENKGVRVALFGDGPVGFVAASYIKYHFGLSHDQFTVFGADDNKLKNFDFANTENVLSFDFENSKDRYDVLIECTGGKFSSGAINQAISIADTRAHIVLMGVSEELVPINTRDILERGITLHGSSRSVTSDFESFVDTIANSEEYQEVLTRLLPKENTEIHSGQDFHDIMKHTAEHPSWNRVIMEFNWK